MKHLRVLATFALLTATASFAQQNTQTQSSTDIQSVQTKSYTKPFKAVYRSILSVLFDNKFRVTFTDMNSGVIVATGTPTASENMSKNTAMIPFIGALIATQRETSLEQWQFVAFVEDLGEKDGVQVRISLLSQTRKAGMNVSASDAFTSSDLTDKPEIYQALFNSIEKAIFIRENIK